jgi:hypothetical protein
MKNLSLPEFITFQVIPHPEGNIIRTSYFGGKVTTEKAIDIIDTLFSLWWDQAMKPLGQEFNAQDVFTIIRELIDNGSISYSEAKTAALNNCSEYVFNTELAQATPPETESETKEEALVEVCEWTDIQDPADLDYTEYYTSADEDTFVLLECTERLYNHVLQHGSTVYDVNDNIADMYNQ